MAKKRRHDYEGLPYPYALANNGKDHKGPQGSEPKQKNVHGGEVTNKRMSPWPKTQIGVGGGKETKAQKQATPKEPKQKK